MSNNMVYGLIGFPLTHSFSVSYFNEKFKREHITNTEYRNFELNDLSELPEVLRITGLKGLNVTIPYKEKIIPYLDKISHEAEKIGAVNTVKIIYENNRQILEGFNTDIYGFSMSLKPFLLNIHQRALILGTGGASKAVKYILENLGIECRFVSRNPGGHFRYEELNKYIIESHLLIVNTTPLGMYPDVDNLPPIPYEFITRNHLLYDLIYNPEETLFLKKGKEQGAVTLNGISMLRLQAEKAWEIWNS